MSKFTVKQLADMAGVSRRTLHYYDEIGLLRPANIGENGYRIYSQESLLRLQQILLFRELGLELSQIQQILDKPAFDPVCALQAHRETLQGRIRRLQTLIRTVDATIMHLTGEVTMSEHTLFEGFDEEQQKEYEKEAVERWGESARESIQLWYSYSDERKQKIMQEGSDIYTGIAARMDLGAGSPEIQALLGRWHQHLRHFYEPTIEILAGLGQTYNDQPDFKATFTRIHPDLPVFLKEAIRIYVDRLETEWLEREAGE
ncbi:MAG: MerR family transcriptional regulator [Anaerolineales bacterium]|nr:MerR family transcriptional regulator [Anaerolineales bacterium]